MAGLPERPSLMQSVRVACEACHTGRSPGGLAERGHPSAAGGSSVRSLPTASAVECLRCHGPAFEGMLAGWQTEVRGQTLWLQGLLAAAESAAGPTEAGAAAAESDRAGVVPSSGGRSRPRLRPRSRCGAARDARLSAQPLRGLPSLRARGRLQAILRDGSLGAHNALLAEMLGGDGLAALEGD